MAATLPIMLRQTILILEDDLTRIDRFKSVLSRFGSEYEMKFWRSAKEMTKELDGCIQTATLISLDHDLAPIEPGGQDPGDGLDVARFLASHEPACPVIIHPSNVSRSEAMAGVLELEGWVIKRVPPIGEDWIEVDWVSAAKKLISK
ncbi:MAG: cyclic-phosphate processing receiver domain-containing protein [Sedimentisphaerales bacterium]